jgi:hypothetical protein
MVVRRSRLARCLQAVVGSLPLLKPAGTGGISGGGGLARSVLRHIRVSCKDELKERLIAFIGDINREPVVHTWRYKIDNAA